MPTYRPGIFWIRSRRRFTTKNPLKVCESTQNFRQVLFAEQKCCCPQRCLVRRLRGNIYLLNDVGNEINFTLYHTEKVLIWNYRLNLFRSRVMEKLPVMEVITIYFLELATSNSYQIIFHRFSDFKTYFGYWSIDLQNGTYPRYRSHSGQEP